MDEETRNLQEKEQFVKCFDQPVRDTNSWIGVRDMYYS